MVPKQFKKAPFSQREIRDFYRKLSDTREFNAGLVTDYIKQTKCDSLDETVFLFRFLQFLSFIRKFEGKRECVDDQVYYIIEFPIVDFLHFLDKDVKSTYQRTKLMEFFKNLQELPPFVEKFSDSEFQSSIMFPLLKLTKQGRSWFLKIAIGEQLYWYSYPFRWTSSLCNFQNKYDLLVKLEIIQVLSTDSLKKKISVEDFLNQFSIPNKKRAEIKNLIIDLLDKLKAKDFQITPSALEVIKNSHMQINDILTGIETSWKSKEKIITVKEAINLILDSRQAGITREITSEIKAHEKFVPVPRQLRRTYTDLKRFEKPVKPKPQKPLQPQPKQKQSPPKLSKPVEKPQAKPKPKILWTDDMVTTARSWMKNMLATINKNNINFSAEPKRYHLKITLASPVADKEEVQKTIFRNCAHLIMKTMQNKFRKQLRYHKVIITSEKNLIISYC